MEIKQEILFLREGLAEFENRVSFLENSRVPNIKDERSEVHTLEPEWTKRQWDVVNQLRGEMRHLSSKVNEMRATKKKTKRYKYA